MKTNKKTGSIKILIVEDESIVASDLAMTLKDFGYEVTNVVASAKGAHLSISTSKPDLVLMDLMIKGSADGLQLSQEVADQYHIPVIHVTANSDKIKNAQMLDSGSYGCIKKPFEDQLLKDMIEKVLDQVYSQ